MDDDVGGDEASWETLSGAAYLMVAVLLERLGGTVEVTPGDMERLGDFRITAVRELLDRKITFRLVKPRARD